MNAEKLKSILLLAERLDHRTGLPSQITSFLNTFDQLTGASTNPELQQSFRTELDDLKATFTDLEQSLSNNQKTQLQEIGALTWLSTSLSDKIIKAIAENSVTPTVALAEIKAIAANRASFMKSLKDTRNGLTKLGITYQNLTPGKPELSVTIPRDLFDNNLSGLIKELRQVNFITRTIAAVSGEEAAEFEIRSISTSDPVFWVETGVKIAAATAAVISWGLATLISIEKLKQARAETARTNAFTEKELNKIFGNKIEQEVEKAKKEIKQDLLGAPNSTRHREIGNQFDSALDALLSRLERAMKIEIHFEPEKIEIQKQSEDGEQTDVEYEISEEHRDLKAAIDNISYIEVDSSPVLHITHVEPDKKDEIKESGDVENVEEKD